MFLRNSIFALLNADITVFPKRQFTVPTGIKVGDQCFQNRAPLRFIPLASIAAASQCGNTVALEATVTHSSEISPPPFMVGAAEVEVDLETGEAQVVNYVAAFR